MLILFSYILLYLLLFAAAAAASDQAVRHRMRLLHGLRCPAYRVALVEVYLCSLSCLLIVSPQQFSLLLQQQPLLLPEFTALLKHAERISSRILLLAADLLSLLLVRS